LKLESAGDHANQNPDVCNWVRKMHQSLPGRCYLS
jgi:hypothetical protein